MKKVRLLSHDDMNQYATSKISCIPNDTPDNRRKKMGLYMTIMEHFGKLNRLRKRFNATLAKLESIQQELRTAENEQRHF